MFGNGHELGNLLDFFAEFFIDRGQMLDIKAGFMDILSLFGLTDRGAVAALEQLAERVHPTDEECCA